MAADYHPRFDSIVQKAAVFVTVVLLVTLDVLPSAAQDSSAERFDVASVVPNHDINATRGFRFERGNGLVATGMALRDLIWAAYQGPTQPRTRHKSLAGQDGLQTDRFDIRAEGCRPVVTDSGTGSERRTLAMLRGLLEDAVQRPCAPRATPPRCLCPRSVAAGRPSRLRLAHLRRHVCRGRLECATIRTLVWDSNRPW